MKNTGTSFVFLGRSGKSEFAYYLLTLICTFTVYLIFQVTYIDFIGIASQNNKSNSNLLISLIPFTIFIFLLLGFARIFHQRSLKSFITGNSLFKFKIFIFCFLFWIVYNSAAEFLNYLLFQQVYTWSFDLMQFLSLFFICITFLILQSATEEIFIRGYMLQFIGSRSGNLWIGIFSTSLLFLALHSANPENEVYGYWMMGSIYFLTGFALAVFTILGNGLEIAIGIHAANNFYTAVFVNSDSSVLQTASLFNTTFNMVWPMLCYSLIGFFILYFVLRKLNWIKSISYLVKFDVNEVPSV